MKKMVSITFYQDSSQETLFVLEMTDEMIGADVYGLCQRLSQTHQIPIDDIHYLLNIV